MKARVFFIAGTDTGAGKTVLSLLFMHYFLMKGENPFYIKPFQTGCADPRSKGSDAQFIYDNIPSLRGRDPGDSVLYCFRQAKAPYFAARDENTTIDPEKFHGFIKEKQKHHTILIVEAAGGLFVPVTEKLMIIDLIQSVDAFPVVAARAGLGTINHTLLTLEALKHRGFDRPGLVFMDTENTDTRMIRENVEAVGNRIDARVAGVIGHLPDFSNPPAKILDTLAVFDEAMGGV